MRTPRWLLGIDLTNCEPQAVHRIQSGTAGEWGTVADNGRRNVEGERPQSPARRALASADSGEDRTGLQADGCQGGAARTHVQALEADIRAWIKTWNKDPKPFIWSKTAEEILDSLARYCRRISGAGH